MKDFNDIPNKEQYEAHLVAFQNGEQVMESGKWVAFLATEKDSVFLASADSIYELTQNPILEGKQYILHKF